MAVSPPPVLALPPDFNPPILTSFLDLVSLSILYYDYAISLSHEVHRFWVPSDQYDHYHPAGRVRYWPRWSWMTCLFFVNRYMSIFGYLPILAAIFDPWPLNNCLTLAQYRVVLQVVVMAAALAPMVLQTYALYSRKKVVLWSLGLVSAGFVGYQAWAASGSVVIPGLVAGHSYICSPWIPFPRHGSGNIIGAIGLLIGLESTLFLMTIHKTYRLRHYKNQPILTAMMRNGTLYFGLLTTARITNIVVVIFAPLIDKTAALNITNVISSTLMSRMMLQLRAPTMASSAEMPVSVSDSETSVDFTNAYEIDILPIRTYRSSQSDT